MPDANSDAVLTVRVEYLNKALSELRDSLSEEIKSSQAERRMDVKSLGEKIERMLADEHECRLNVSDRISRLEERSSASIRGVAVLNTILAAIAGLIGVFVNPNK